MVGVSMAKEWYGSQAIAHQIKQKHFQKSLGSLEHLVRSDMFCIQQYLFLGEYKVQHLRYDQLNYKIHAEILHM